MNKILYLLLLVCWQFSIAQNSETINKIRFIYSIGGMSRSNGINSRTEIFELIKREKGDFKLISHLKINDIRRNAKFKKDTVEIKIDKYPIIAENEIQDLLRELNTNRENYTEEFLKPYFTKPTKKEILKIAKECNRESYLKNDYSGKRYQQIQEYKYFEEFINADKPSIENIEITFDAWNKLEIETFSKEKTIIYSSEYFKNCGQPISIQDIAIENIPSQQIINLNVNLILQKIVPKSSMISKTVDLNAIKMAYIEWYLENKIFEF